jgi:hypothetical protein
VQVRIKQIKDLEETLDEKALADLSNVLADVAIVTTSPTLISMLNSVVVVTRNSPTVLNLPSDPSSGKMIKIKDGNGNAAVHNITIQGNGKLIDGESSLVINVNYSGVSLVYNGSQWNVIGRPKGYSTPFGSSGLIDSNVKFWTGSVASSNGVWTCDISSANFTTVLFVGANARPNASSGINANDSCFVSVSRQESSNTSIRGYVKSQNVSGLLTTFNMVNANTTVDVFVVGT